MTVQEIISLFGRYRHRTNDVEISQLCGLGASATSTKIKTANAIVIFLYNQQVSLAANTAITPTTCAQQAADTFCYYLVSATLAGAFVCTKGTNNAYSLPTTPAGSSPVGAFRITTVAVTFTLGTTAFTASGVTPAFYDIDCGVTLSLINRTQERVERGVTIVRKNSQRTIMDWDYMKVRATVALVQGDTVVTLPFPNFKDFVDEGIILTDASGLVTRLEKQDTVPIGVTSFQLRPQNISRRIIAETVFTTDGYPGMQFEVWPAGDQSYALDVQAYQYSPPLDGVIYSQNWLTDNAPDILLFGALSESGLYFGADPQIKEWEAKFQEAVWTLSASQEKAKIAGSHIGTKFPNPLGGGNQSVGRYQGIMNYGY